MKILPLILASLLLVVGIPPCPGNLAVAAAHTSTTETCGPTEDQHSCCQHPDSGDPDSEEEDPCTDDCACYCCALILALPNGMIATTLLPGANHRPSWQPNAYTHDFTHLIWQPPQAA